MFNSQDPPRESEEGEGKRETKHAPDLLEGPDIDEEGRGGDYVERADVFNYELHGGQHTFQ